MSRPELQCPPEVFYNASEARKYNSSSRMVGIQSEITERCIELLNLPAGESRYILDVGCGSGLSGEVLEEAGHVWLGLDISRDMLDVANERDTESGDLCHHDMGTGLPFHRATFDGCISVSALQWLCYAQTSQQSARARLNRFFGSLYACLKRRARAALQFYPETPEQAMLIAQCAARAGFTGGLVVDYPNSAKAKKFYLCLSFEHGYRVPRALGDGDGASVAACGGGDGGASNGGGGEAAAAASSVRVEGRRVEGAGGGGSRGAVSKKPLVSKSREWVKEKKDRQRRQGKEVRQDTKYTGRKRKDKF